MFIVIRVEKLMLFLIVIVIRFDIVIFLGELELFLLRALGLIGSCYFPENSSGARQHRRLFQLT